MRREAIEADGEMVKLTVKVLKLPLVEIDELAGEFEYTPRSGSLVKYSAK